MKTYYYFINDPKDQDEEVFFFEINEGKANMVARRYHEYLEKYSFDNLDYDVNEMKLDIEHVIKNEGIEAAKRMVMWSGYEFWKTFSIKLKNLELKDLKESSELNNKTLNEFMEGEEDEMEYQGDMEWYTN